MFARMSSHYRCLFVFLGWFIMLVSCQHTPSSFLEKAIQMEYTSIDSSFFYLQQIDNPKKLSPREQGDYNFLSYKTTLWKTGKPADSLLHIAIRYYMESGQLSKYMQACIAQSASCLYRNQPDSTLLFADLLLRKHLLNDTLKAQIYGLKRAAYSMKRDYTQALNMADSSRQFSRACKDTFVYFSVSQVYLHLLKQKQEYDKYELESHQLIEELTGSSNYQYLNFHIFGIFD